MIFLVRKRGQKSTLFPKAKKHGDEEKKMVHRSSVRDAVRAQARTKYRLADVQITVIKRMSEDGASVAPISRAASCSRKAVYVWRAEDKTKCDAGTGRPRTVRTPEVMQKIAAVVQQHANQPLSHEQLRATVAKKTGVRLSTNVLHHAKKELGIKGKTGRNKPEYAFFPVNRAKRVTAAKRRKRAWTKADRRKLVFMDESCAARRVKRIFQVPRGGDGKWARPIVPKADDKDEKVHFFVVIGYGTTFFKALAVRRPVLKDAQQNTIHRRGRQRRKKGKATTKRLNQPNQGQTWTAKRLKTILRPLLPKLKKASGVVLDNASAHKELRAYLERSGVTVFDHPPHSPDLNLAEDYIRDLKNEVMTNKLPRNNKELRNALTKTSQCKRKRKKFLALHEKRCDGYNFRLNQVVARGGLPTDF